MKKSIGTLVFFFSFSLVFCQSASRTVYQLTDGWSFHRGDFVGAERPSLDDGNWSKVRVPHDWAISGPFNKEVDKQIVAIEQNGEKVPTEKTGRTGSLPYVGVGWYRTVLPQADLDNKKAILLFEGAMSEAQVFINGQKVGFWPYGYNTFHFDITAYLNPDSRNILAVRLENRALSSRWYPGAGLYRPVTLQLLNKAISVPIWGTTVTTPVVSEEYARVNVKTKIDGAKGRNLRVVSVINDLNGVVVGQQDRMFNNIHHIIEENIEIDQPNLWSPESPALYYAVTKIYDGERLVDVDSVRFGIREVRVTPEEGFVLNGKSRKIKGVCLHHDLGPLGAALNKAALRRQLQLMKDMGADAIRTAHNMPSSWQMELCDEMGIMVVAESFDEWNYPKTKNGYNLYFDQWAERDLVNLIRCHRNHPSIVMWSIGNEVPEQGRADGGRIAKRLQDICHREDPTRLVTVGMDRITNAIENGFAPLLDIPGLNYRTHLYESAYKKLPQGFILGSETASTVSSRGVYKFPVVEGKNKTYPDGQSSSYDLEYCSWSNLPEDDWILQDDMDWVIGEFVWTGFDYLGEPTPYDEYWPSRSSYFGICDLAGIPKDRYYLYRSRWNTQENTLHLLPHWNWKGKEGDTIPVYCYTNQPEAELFINGKSQGRRKKDPSSRLDRYRLRWNDVIYEAGTVKVVAYNSDGVAVEEKEMKTAGKPAGLRLTPDRQTLSANGEDLVFVTVEVVDKEGNLCPTSDTPLTFDVNGAGRFKAACNGDATSLVQFQQPNMPVFNGKLVVIIESGEVAGDMVLRVNGKGLKTSLLRLNSQ